MTDCTSFADERQQEVAVGQPDLVVLQHGTLAAVVSHAVAVDPRSPLHVVVILELRDQLAEVALSALRVARPRQTTAERLQQTIVTTTTPV